MSELTQITPNDQGRSEHELRQAIDFYGVFLAMAGHDLRQPLQTIMSTFEWLVRRLHTTSEQEYLRRGRFAVTRLSEQLDLLIEAIRLHEHSANVQPDRRSECLLRRRVLFRWPYQRASWHDWQYRALTPLGVLLAALAVQMWSMACVRS